ncbi:MAG: glycoside hydrolase family 43 protein [Opitutales bacterium]
MIRIRKPLSRWCGGLAAGVCLASLSPLSAQTGTPVHSRNASVHDPSVIKVGERYYVFGSHGASAWTEDLMNWTQVAFNVNSGNPRHFANFQSDLSELVSWTNANTLWAPDVIQLDDGRFYYYYCVWTDYQGYRSYMGLAVADTVEGPYTHVTELMRGGTGVSGFNPSVDPNTIDPTLVREPDGSLWMVYGSYSGGIFILEMDPTDGTIKPGQSEWGTHLWGGQHGRIEGPYIIYNAETEYYYLFNSYYGLGANDGYNIRVARSRSITGPYLDSEGTDMATVRGNDATIANSAVKLMGGYRFVSQDDEADGSSLGYLAPGHNSALYDAELDKYLLFFHTRFAGRGEQHEVRIHQIYFNEDGWPVIAPQRYAGETLRSYRDDLLEGSWQVIDHGPKTFRSGEMNSSTSLELNANGTVSGSMSGTWELVGDHDIRLTLDGTEYRGVVSHQWDFDHKLWTMAFSALSPDGIALWGAKDAVDRTSLETFRLIHFGSTANSGNGADWADPNGNGIPNLLEYALHADPMATNATPPMTMEYADGDLRLNFDTILDPDLTYRVLSGSDLTPTSVLWSSTGASNTLGPVTVEADDAAQADVPTFLQLEVER